ncbi:winged helix-turn-helix domain-containing protein [Ewingella sp. S1.OA.A_B6]
MNYLIENKIVFNPEDNSLSLLNDAESKITVSNPARRVLSLLLEQHGTVVERETFFKKVWDDYGLTASNNNLNHCISKLRKVIVTLGYLDEFIVTVPKVGFTIRKERDITSQLGITVAQERTAALPEETLTAPETPDVAKKAAPTETAESEQQSASLSATKKINYKYPFIFSAFFLFSFFAWVFYTLHGVMSDPKAKLQISRIGACELYSTAPVSQSRKENFIQLAQTFILKQKITCTPGDILIFQGEQFTAPINTSSVRVFMAQCSTNGAHKVNICISYYVNDRTTNDKF